MSYVTLNLHKLTIRDQLIKIARIIQQIEQSQIDDHI
jgi:hypothetical protein